ncbi:MAG: hypothetical protein MRY79_04035 [Alphaproteobacteria bacterium]|nr:hypothetical protein [Alphaproteobacteria bacterium]
MIDDPHDYIPLIEGFLEKKIPPKDFQLKFFEKIGTDRYLYKNNEDYFELIDSLCYYVDAYVDEDVFTRIDGRLFDIEGEPVEPDEHDLDEDQLREVVTKIYNEIKALK